MPISGGDRLSLQVWVLYAGSKWWGNLTWQNQGVAIRDQLSIVDATFSVYPFGT